MGSRRRTRLTLDQIRGILAAQRDSGLSVRAYALEHGIPVSTLALWARRHSAHKSPALVPLRVRELPDAERVLPGGLSFRVELPGGATIVIDGAPRGGELRSLLQDLGLL
jgi:hypothetical protein